MTDAANIDSTQLLCIGAATDGAPVNPKVTVRFATPTLVDRIVVHGGSAALNLYPGAIESATIGIGDTRTNMTSVPTGLPNDIGVPRDDVFDLTTSGLSSIPTTEVAANDIIATFFGSPLDQAAIAEITVEGRVPATPVDLDIRPLTKRNVVDLSSRLPLPLAVLSSASMDVRTIDVATLRFGHSGGEDSLRGCSLTPDINRDRRPDLAFLATIRQTGLLVSDTKAVLAGRTKSGTSIVGQDDVIVRP